LPLPSKPPKGAGGCSFDLRIGGFFPLRDLSRMRRRERGVSTPPVDRGHPKTSGPPGASALGRTTSPFPSPPHRLRNNLGVDLFDPGREVLVGGENFHRPREVHCRDSRRWRGEGLSFPSGLSCFPVISGIYLEKMGRIPSSSEVPLPRSSVPTVTRGIHSPGVGPAARPLAHRWVVLRHHPDPLHWWEEVRR
jgi:hypothetical protein